MVSSNLWTPSQLPNLQHTTPSLIPVAPSGSDFNTISLQQPVPNQSQFDAPSPSPSMLHPPNFPKASHSMSLKLSHKYYPDWKAQIISLLKGQGVFGYVYGSVDSPPLHDAHYVVWYQRDQFVISLLFSSLTEEVVAIPIGQEIARAIWLALEASLASALLSRSLQLQAAAHELKQNNLTILEYMAKAKVSILQCSRSDNSQPLRIFCSKFFSAYARNTTI